MVQNYIRPCAPVLRRTPPSGPEWVHEIKWDGWRLQAHKEGAEVRLYSRPGNDLTARLPAIADALRALPQRAFVLDGELVAFDENNRPDFYLLRRKSAAVVAWFFDALSINLVDLRPLPWTERRRRFERVMARNRNPLLQLNEAWDDGEALLRACAEQGLEGIVSKLRSAPYISGPTDAWIKTKVQGWTESNRRRFKHR